MNARFKISGLDCANCAAELERAIQKIDGINSVNINFIMEKMDLSYNDENEDEIIKKLKKVIRKNEPDVSIERI